MRNKALSPEQQQLSQLAGLSSSQVQKKLESDFKNIFGAKETSPIIDENSKFPKITQIQQFTDRQKADSKASASKADALRTNSKSRTKNAMQTTTGFQNVMGKTVKNTRRNSFSQEPIMAAYNTAHRKIKDNIATA